MTGVNSSNVCSTGSCLGIEAGVNIDEEDVEDVPVEGVKILDPNDVGDDGGVDKDCTDEIGVTDERDETGITGTRVTEGTNFSSSLPLFPKFPTLSLGVISDSIEEDVEKGSETGDGGGKKVEFELAKIDGDDAVPNIGDGVEDPNNGDVVSKVVVDVGVVSEIGVTDVGVAPEERAAISV